MTIQTSVSPTASSPAALATANPSRALAPPSPTDTFDAKRPETWSPLQRHAEFFDRNQDGRITVTETYQGLRALGVGVARSALFATLINAGLGLTTGAPWHRPLEIQVNRIQAGKHGSDTGVYDADGRLDMAKFDAIFETHDTDADGSLGRDEVARMIAANRTDAAGNLASKAEFSLLMTLAGTDRVRDGQTERVLTRENMVALYDGSLFYRVAGEPCPFQP